MKSIFRSTYAFVLVLLLCANVVAQEKQSTPQAPGTAEGRQPEAPQPTGKTEPQDPLANMKFRNLGPAVGGGRVTSVVGVPGQPNIYYVGSAAGGVFKTTDGGLSWKAIFEKQPVASIGAVAVAPSNPNLVWVGTGESNPRNDVVSGRGVYFSPDAGASWRLMGLENTGAISKIVINPDNPDIVYVAALGHVWGPNAERGIFRTTDGGHTWRKVLFVNENTGASDLVMDPGNPLVLFAGLWEFERRPWMLASGGNASGVYRSKDGGVTWSKLTDGLPKGQTGRIGLAAAPSNPNHIYAEVESKDGIVWDSTDLGDHWKVASKDRKLNVRPFYFSQLVVSPDSEDHVYFLSFDIVESLDGGKTSKITSRGVHPDNHTMWIDPQQPSRIIAGNDGGVYVSSDAGKTWRYLDNIPIEQFYMVATDDHDPYMICGGLQDNNGWCGPSNSLSRGGESGADWWTAVGGDGEYVVPAGLKTNIVYADSQNGFVQRLDSQNGVSRYVRPYLQGVGQAPPSELKYRFNWTSPIAVSTTDANTVFLGGNALFRSSDGGAHWSAISPDLTRNDKSKQQSSGGSIELDLSGAETFDTILSISLSRADNKVIWIGTDDGLVQMTRDGGEHWSNVTPKGAPEWGRIQQIEASPLDAGTAYVAVDLHEMDNDKPYVFKTHDYGKTWTSIAKGLPENVPARVVREDPNHKGFLVLGTDTGLFYSHNDGETWTPLKSNFPTVPIYDIQFHMQNRDLIVATHGRGVFILDDIRPLEEFTPQVASQSFHVFSNGPAHQWHMWNKRGFSVGSFVAPNPPRGAVISYLLAKEVEPSAEEKAKHRGPVKIVVTDASGQPVKTFYGEAKRGINRATWTLDYDGPVKLNFVAPPTENEFFDRNQGPPVMPGTYKVAVTLNGQTETQTVEVTPDPRLPFDEEAQRAQVRAALEVRDEVSALNRALNRAESLRSQLGTVQKLLASSEEPSGEATVTNAAYKPVLEQAKALDKRVKSWEETVFNTEAGGDENARLHYLQRFNERAESLMRAVSSPYNQAPNELLQEEMAEVRKQLDQHLVEFNTLLKTDVSDFNKVAFEHGANTLFAGGPIEVKNNAGASSGEE